jgi:hypothetical protein
VTSSLDLSWPGQVRVRVVGDPGLPDPGEGRVELLIGDEEGVVLHDD